MLRIRITSGYAKSSNRLKHRMEEKDLIEVKGLTKSSQHATLKSADNYTRTQHHPTMPKQ